MSGIIGKRGWLLVLLAGTFVVPYALCDKQLRASLAKALGRGEPAAANAIAPSSPADAAQPAPAVAPIPLSPQAPPCDLASALHFDVTPQWVTGAWPRVTTAVADTKFSGLRVPLTSAAGLASIPASIGGRADSAAKACA